MRSVQPLRFNGFQNGAVIHLGFLEIRLGIYTFDSAETAKIRHLELRRFNDFWATVCKTVRPMLSDRCPV